MHLAPAMARFFAVEQPFDSSRDAQRHEFGSEHGQPEQAEDHEQSDDGEEGAFAAGDGKGHDGKDGGFCFVRVAGDKASGYPIRRRKRPCSRPTDLPRKPITSDGFPMTTSTVGTLRRVLALVAILALGSAGNAAEPGQPAPDFVVTDIAGQTHSLASYRGKVVVLEWLNPGCPFVVRHYRSGNMQSTQQTAAADGAIWLQVNSGSVGDLDAAKSVEWQKKQGVTATAYIRDETGKLGRLFGAKTTPHVFVVGKDGRLVYQGAIDDQPTANVVNTPSAHNYVRAALAALRAGQPVQPANSEPYGCGVKYGAEG